MSTGESQLVLESLRQEGGRWLAVLSFRGKSYGLALAADHSGRIRAAEPSPFALTREGQDVFVLVDRIRRGEQIALPSVVVPGEQRGRLPSIHDEDWSDWSNREALTDVWLDSAERSADNRWRARLRLNHVYEDYELEILPGPTLRELRGPANPAFEPYTFDLTRLLLRMNSGERFALPFCLRTRWPTPEDPKSL